MTFGLSPFGLRPFGLSAESGSTAPSDTEAPTWTGPITVGAKTDTTIALTIPTASDNVAVTGYEYRIDGGSWVSCTTSVSITGLTALTSYDIDARALDAASNASTVLSVTTSTYRAGDTGANILADTGPVGSSPAGILYDDVDAGDEAKWFSFYIVTPPASGTLTINPNGAFTFTGSSSTFFTYQLEVDGVEVGTPQTVDLYGTASYTLTADAGSYSLTGQDAGLSYAPGSGAYSLTAEFGAYSLAGVDASVNAGRNLSAEFGAYTLTGQDAGVSVGRRVAGEFGAYSLNGQDATLTATGAVSYSLTAEVGLYSIDGQPVTLTGPETGGLTTAASGLIPKIWPLTVRYEGKRRSKHDQDEEKRIQEIAEEAVLQAAEEASKRAMKASIEASMKAAQLELAAATMDRLLKLAVKVHEEKMEEEELEMVLALL